jgi:hypothetical protein
MIGKNLLKEYNYYICLPLLVLLNILIRWYHSFGVKSISYANGDAFGIVLNSMLLDQFKGSYLTSYILRIFQDLTLFQYTNITFYFGPIISSILIIVIFSMIKRHYGYIAGVISCLLIILNPWLAMYSTDVSKEIFVLFFLIMSLDYFLFYLEKKEIIFLVVSMILFIFGTMFYQSMLLYLPIYLLIILLFEHKKSPFIIRIKKFLKMMLLFFIIFLVIAMPFYMISLHEERLEMDKKIQLGLSTESINYGNSIQRQIGSMFSAITKNPEELGIINLTNGIINRYLFNNYLLILIFFTGFIFAFKKEDNLLLCLILLSMGAYILAGMRWNSYSHGSRYPQYIVYTFFMCVGIILSKLIHLVKNKRSRIVLLVGIILFVIMTANTFKYVEGLRHIYIPQLEAATLFKNGNISINQENQVLYLNWPAITIGLIKENNSLFNYLHTFGFGNTNLTEISSLKYIQDNNITYYIYDHAGGDYFNSSTIVLRNLQGHSNLSLIDKTSRKDLFVSLYIIGEKK